MRQAGLKNMVEAHLQEDMKQYVDPDILSKVPRETIMRLPKIVELLGTMPNTQVAKEMGIGYWTLCQDLRYLRETGWYDSFIVGNFIKAKRDLPDTEEAKLVIFKEFSKLFGKLITTKPDTKVGIEIGESDGSKVIRVLTDYNEVIIKLADPESFRRLIPNNHTIKQMDQTEPSTEAK